MWRNVEPGMWDSIAIDGLSFGLDAAGPFSGVTGDDLPSDNGPAALVRRIERHGAEEWVLIARPGSRVSVNGLAVDLGIVVLRDRDEIRWPPAPPLYFSTERLAAIVPYPAGARGFCPRCKDPIQAGQAAVRCPGCGLWHHAMDERPCWTYDAHCAACPQPTTADAGFRWTPEEL